MSHIETGLRTYVIEHGNAEQRRRAELGHDVRSIGIKLFAESMRACFGSRARLLVQGDTVYERTRWERRDNPHERAVLIRDETVVLIEALKDKPPVEIQVMPVQRVIETFADDTFHKETAVVVRIIAPMVGARVIIIGCEE